MSGEMLRLVVTENSSGLRLDRFAADSVPDLSRSYARQLIEDSHILLNDTQSRPSASVRVGDVVTLILPEPQPTGLIPEDIPLTVVYEDADVIVIDKPVGMVVHPAPGHPTGTLVNALLSHYPDIVVGGDLRPGIVHRLDRETSGLLVVARHDIALRHLQEQQQARTMTKIYLAVAEGRFRETDGIIDAPIGRHPSDRLKMAVAADGRSARTHYSVLEELGEYTLLSVRLETGRTHQIRVHFAYKQRPILGDPLYGLKRPRSHFGITRQFLHAHQLGFVLPTSGERVEFMAALPDDLDLVLQKLRRHTKHSEV